MNNLFHLQLLISFVVGGTAIAVLSFLAERANERIAGVILAFPTTAALGFFFLGWALSAGEVASVVPATFIPLGLSVLFAVIYPFVALFVARLAETKLVQITVSYLLSILVWFLLAVPVAALELNNLPFNITGYFLLIGLAHFIGRSQDATARPTLTYSTGQKIGRVVFVGFIIFLVVLLGKLLGPFWGIIFTMFPAAFTSTLLVLHWYYEPNNLLALVQKVPVGSLSIFMYALVVMLVFPGAGILVGTVIAYAVSFVAALILTRLNR